MSNKPIEIKKVVDTIKVLRNTCDVIHTENQHLSKMNQDLRSENDRLREGEAPTTIDNADLLAVMSEVARDVRRWRVNSLSESKAREQKSKKIKDIDSISRSSAQSTI